MNKNKPIDMGHSMVVTRMEGGGLLLEKFTYI